jgi:pimeloyl-ACP methyl ester carboxylesterase
MQTVVSRDGTPIAFAVSGSGPALVLVHGTAATHRRWNAVLPLLEAHFTLAAMDRRGRGESGDRLPYAIERECEDVAAVIAEQSAPVLLFGHSFGAICALETAMRTGGVAGLILYEPPIFAGKGLSYDMPARMDAWLAAGDREAVVTAFIREVVGIPAEQFSRFRASPAFPDRLAAAHTLPREMRAADAYVPSATRIGGVSVPVLLLLGAASPPLVHDINAVLERYLPDVATVTMAGQKHMAMDTAPEMVATAVIDFWRERIALR